MTVSRLLPWLALLVTVLIWASYLVVVRAAVTGDLSPADVGLLRTAPAALAFLPYTLRHGLRPSGAGIPDVFWIGIIGGGAFIVLLSTGLTFAPTADGGVFTPTILPVWVAILAVLLAQQRYHVTQIIGLATILAGAAIFGGATAIFEAQAGAWRGHLLFILASLSWAIYTFRFRQSGLSPVAGTAIMATIPAMLFVVWIMVQGTSIHQLPPEVLALQLGQGLAAGLIANFTFFYAIQHLGPSIPAASAALVPVLAAIGAWLFLGEPISTVKAIGMAIAACGVVLASGLVSRR